VALVPHGPSLTVAEMTRLAAAFNHPLSAVAADRHAGRLPAAGSAVLSVSPSDVVVGAVKRAEDDGSIVFRLLETAGKATTARLELAPLLGTPSAAEEIDFLERPVGKGTARLAAGALSVDIPAHGVASVRVRLD
jgi:alpha-mannosidase